MEQSYPGQTEVVHKSFLLVPEPRERSFTAYHLQHRQAAQEMTGLPFDLPAVGSPYPRSSFPAQEASQWVARHAPGAFAEFNLALFEAFFGETRDIGDPLVLADLVRRFDLSGEELLTALGEGSMQDAVFDDHVSALERGITGIPAVLIGDAVISGAVPYEQYQQALLRTEPPRKAEWTLQEKAS